VSPQLSVDELPSRLRRASVNLCHDPELLPSASVTTPMSVDEHRQ